MPVGGRQSNLDRGGPQEQLQQCPNEWQWPCRNGECIPRYDICDGTEQCSDGSDEWNCGQWGRMNQGGFRGMEQGMAGPAVTQAKVAVTTATTTTTAAPDSGYVVLTTHQIYLTLFLFIVLALAIVWVVRRRARQRALMRNRRGNILSKFQAQDSDEDDILISSMYS